MSINRWMNVALLLMVVGWGLLAVGAEMPSDVVTETRPSPDTLIQTEATPSPVSASTPLPPVTTPVPAVTPSSTPLLTRLLSKPTPAPTAAVTPPLPSPTPVTPAASSPSTPVPTPTPVTTISYRVQGGGVYYEGNVNAAGLSVGEATKRLAAQRGFSFVYEASSLGWFVTEIAGIKQNPAQDQYWLYFVNGGFGEVSADKKILNAGDTLVWQFGS